MSISRLIQMGTAGVSAGGGGVVWTDPDIANLSYDSVNFDLNLAASIRGMFFKPDGTKLFLSHDTGNRDVKEYTMSTAWDISTLSNTSNFSALSQITSGMQGIFFKPDGYAFYLVDFNGSRVLEYSLSTAWDVSTASYSSNAFTTTGENNPRSVYFKPDGTKMYVTGSASDNVIEYALSTAWDITTGSSQATFSVASQASFPAQISFNPTGTKMYLTTYSSSSDIFEYSLSTGWDVSTASYNSVSYGDATLTNPVTHAFKSDGSKAYFIDDTDIIYQYST